MLEWENAGVLEQDEALGFLRDLNGLLGRFREPRPDVTLSVAVIFDGHPSAEAVAGIVETVAAGIDRDRITLLATEGVPYYNKKQMVAWQVEADVLVFCDSDCRYADTWLDALTDPLLRGEADFVFGKTDAMIEGNAVARASSLAWFFSTGHPSDPREKRERRAPVFRANNFAVRPEVMRACPIPIHKGSRAHGGMWVKALRARQVRVRHVAEAHAMHRQFDTVAALLARGAQLGVDRAVQAAIAAPGAQRHAVGRALLSGPAALGMFLRRFRSPARGLVSRGAPDTLAILGLGLAFVLVEYGARLGAALRMPDVAVSDDYAALRRRVSVVPVPVL